MIILSLHCSVMHLSSVMWWLCVLLSVTSCSALLECDTSCNFQLVESIPENLTYPSGSPSSMSTYDAWKALISSAKQTVDIASYYWSLRGHGNVTDVTDKEGSIIFDELAALKGRGVKLHIVQNIPSKEYPDLDTEYLSEKGLAQVQNIDLPKLLSSGGILHTKLWVVDGKHFYVGSANMDWRSLTQVKELGILGTDCECLAADAQRLFDVYWYLSSPGATVPSHWPQEYLAMFNMTNPLQVNSRPVNIFWASSPPSFCAGHRTNDIDALLNAINSAEQFVNIAVMDYFTAVVYQYPKHYWDVIDDALRKAAFDRGVHVRLLGSYWNHTEQDMLNFMRSLSAVSSTGSYHGLIETRLFVVPPLKTKDIPYTRVNHNKYMVTDKAAYIGTSNWSGDYFINTGGLSLTLSSATKNVNPTIQQQLVHIFMRDWNSTYSTPLI